MNCLDFRRLCLVEPANRDPRVYLHLYHCPTCRAYRRKVLLAERTVKAAMDVPVPESLGSRIVFDSEMQPGNMPAWPTWQAWVAGVLVAVALGSGLSFLPRTPDVVPMLAMHIAADPLHMTPPQADAPQRLDQVMRHLGGTWLGAKPVITHATLCLVKDRTAAHLVVAGKQGPVTVFLIPKFRARDRNDVAVDGQLAEVQALASGSMALFGYPGEDFAAIASQFDASIHWTETLASGTAWVLVAGK